MFSKGIVKQMKNKILLIIFIISLISSIILISVNNGNTFCGVGQKSDCNAVQNSKYAYLFGISNSLYGVIIFSLLSLTTISQIIRPKKNKQLLIDASAISGFIIALYFIYLQSFVIKEFCKYCMVIDVAMIIAFFLVIPKDFSAKK